MQRQEAVQEADALKEVLMGISGAHLSEGHASAFCMLGSLEDVACCGMDDILDNIDVSPAQCALPLSWP